MIRKSENVGSMDVSTALPSKICAVFSHFPSGEYYAFLRFPRGHTLIFRKEWGNEESQSYLELFNFNGKYGKFKFLLEFPFLPFGSRATAGLRGSKMFSAARTITPCPIQIAYLDNPWPNLNQFGS